jgi:hypothetical protein
MPFCKSIKISAVVAAGRIIIDRASLPVAQGRADPLHT